MREDLSAVELRILGTRANVAELEAINTTILKDGALVFITDPGVIYALLVESTATPDGDEVVAPISGPGRWLLQTSEANADGEVITHLNWYVDPVNGDDTNDGMTPATAFKTYQYGLSPRFDGARFDMGIVRLLIVNQMAPVPDDDVYWANTSLTGDEPGQLYIRSVGSTVLLTGVITAATNGATNVRAQFTVAGADFTGMENKRVRITAGTDVDGVGWIQRVISPTTVFVTQPLNLSSGSGTNQFRVGDTIVVEDLYKAPAVTGMNTTRWYFFAPIAFESLTFESSQLLSRQGCTMWSCKIEADTLSINTNTIYLGCRVQASVFLGRGYQGFENCSMDLPLIICDEIECSRSSYNFRAMTMLKGTLLTRNYFHIWDWSTAELAGLTMEPGTTANLAGRLVGTSTNAGTYGMRVRSGAQAYYPAAGTKPTLAGAAAFNVDVGGTQLVYANVPALSVNAANFAVIALRAP